MLQAVWSRLCRRRSLLLARDLLDADLDRARRKPGCALCRLVQEHDQQAMHSFLWEYCTDPHVGMQISTSWGFCPYHSWSLAMMEHERMGDGLGISTVYQALLRQLHCLLSSDRQAKNQNLHLLLPAGPEIGSAQCRFCQSAGREESLFLTRLTQRFQQSINSGAEREWSSLQTELCLPHMKHFLEACSTGRAMRPPRWSLSGRGNRSAPSEASEQSEIQRLAARLLEYAVQRAIERDTQREGAQQDWSQIARNLAFLMGDREALPVHTTSTTGRMAVRQLLLLTGQRSQLHSPSSKGCRVCAAAASACIAMCLSAFEQDEAFPSIAAFCQSHQWILAAGIVLYTDAADRYRSWLKQQLEQQQAALARAEGYRDLQSKQICMACARAAESEEESITSLIEELRQTTYDLTSPQEELLCLYHWKQTHDACRYEPDALILQERLLHRQQQHLTQLDEAVEAYLARFNATKRERGEVPDVPGAAWAWERLLAFFAGEPVLILPVGM
jgi:hypothetical protein